MHFPADFKCGNPEHYIRTSRINLMLLKRLKQTFTLKSNEENRIVTICYKSIKMTFYGSKFVPNFRKFKIPTPDYIVRIGLSVCSWLHIRAHYPRAMCAKKQSKKNEH